MNHHEGCSMFNVQCSMCVSLFSLVVLGTCTVVLITVVISYRQTMLPVSFLNIVFLLAMPLDRRTMLSSVLSSSITLPAKCTNKDDVVYIKDNGSTSSCSLHESWSTIIPLERSSGGTNSIRATLSYEPTTSLFGTRTYIPKKVFKLIVDTGSPYLVISDGMEYTSFVDEVINTNADQKRFPSILEFVGGILEGAGIDNFQYNLKSSGYDATEEIYGSQKGNIAWKESYIQMRDDRLSKNVVLGVLDNELTNEAGGPLLGMVKFSNSQSEKVQLRPTFLEQGCNGKNCISSFMIDSPNRELLLVSGKSLLPPGTNSVIPLVDLRPLGDFVEHYACQVQSLILNGIEFTADSLSSKLDKKRSIVAVFDSGLTGCLFTQPLWDDLQKNGANLNNVKAIDVGVDTEKMNTRSEKSELYNFRTSEEMNPFFKLDPISLDWFDDEETCPYVVVLGQTFLIQGSLTIDIDYRRAMFRTAG